MVKGRMHMKAINGNGRGRGTIPATKSTASFACHVHLRFIVPGSFSTSSYTYATFRPLLLDLKYIQHTCANFAFIFCSTLASIFSIKSCVLGFHVFFSASF